ncbi:coiled-coil domain-containing protein 17 isoform X4 [Chiroxiphia lanceolata]|uniref:coiled-coil domain-containing protein 17 isoform X4 n=1 Tax=Chiroxiphia lanceolata TaxID=296741 RepID=UPI0013CEB125|nr:coiled-coil domain-containing protein 17 isoform X4 [Chiroxiphia lanceolata]
MEGTLCLWRGRRARQGGHRAPRSGCPCMGTTLSHTITLSSLGSQLLCRDSRDRGGHGGLPWGPCSPPARGPCSARPTPLPGGPQCRYSEPPAPVGTSTSMAPHTLQLVGVQPLLPAESPCAAERAPPAAGPAPGAAAATTGASGGPQTPNGRDPGQDPAAGAAEGRATLYLDTLLPPMGPLAAEARALRLSYLRAGGHDPAILDQLLHLQLEATVLEKGTAGLRRGRRMGKAQPQPRLPAGSVTPQPAPEAPPAVPAEPPGTGTQGLDAALLAVELENWRLEDEVLALKVRRERRADAGSRAAQWHSEELAQLRAEVGMLRCHAEQAGPRLPPPILPPTVAPPLPPALAVPELFTEPPGPALGPGSPTAHVPHSLPLSTFVALEDPPPAQEPPEQHKPPRRLLDTEGGTPRTHSRFS